MATTADLAHGAITVYSRPGCHLCEKLIEDLLPLIRGRLGLEIIDIDTNADLQVTYGTRIPVVEFESEFVCQYVLDIEAVQEILRTRGNV